MSPPAAQINPLRTLADWQAARAECECETDPGTYHGNIAARELHWFDPHTGAGGAWLSLHETQGWYGWDALTGAPLRSVHPPQ